MAWKDLNVRDRAQFIRQMVSLGITNNSEQEKFYNESISAPGKRQTFNPTKSNTAAYGGNIKSGESPLGFRLTEEYGDADENLMKTLQPDERGHYSDEVKYPWHITYPSGQWIQPSLLEQQWTGNNQPIFVPSKHNYAFYRPEDYFNYPHDKTLTQKFVPTGWNKHLTF